MLNGLPGAGKTSLARALALECDAVHLSSDAIRTEFFGVEGMESVRDTRQANCVVYEILLLRAESALRCDRHVVCDGMNNHPPGWRRYLSMGAQVGVTPLFLDIDVPTDELRARVVRRGRALEIHERLLRDGNSAWATEEADIMTDCPGLQWRQDVGEMTLFRPNEEKQTWPCKTTSDATELLRSLQWGC